MGGKGISHGRRPEILGPGIGGSEFQNRGKTCAPCVLKVEGYSVGQNLLIMLQGLLRRVHGVQPVAFRRTDVHGKALYLIEQGTGLNTGAIHDKGKSEGNEEHRRHEPDLKGREEDKQVSRRSTKEHANKNAEKRTKE